MTKNKHIALFSTHLVMILSNKTQVSQQNRGKERRLHGSLLLNVRLACEKLRLLKA
jgi:hypothetical protein